MRITPKCSPAMLAGLLLLSALTLPAKAELKVGVNVGAPIWSGSILFNEALADDIASSGCRSVRVNFRIDGNPTWDAAHLAKYDQIISTAIAHNFEVTGIIAYEAVSGSQAQWNENFDTTGMNAYIETFGDMAWLLINRYKDDVKYFEIWNEPSCWSTPPGTNPTPGCFYIYPNCYANLLAEVYYECTAQGGATFFEDNGIALITGGLFAHDIAPLSTAMDYMRQVYQQSSTWTTFQSLTGRDYPWDYFGYHFYLNQGTAVSTSELSSYFSDVRFWKNFYNDTTDIFLTEFGWNTTAVTPELQADNLTDTYDWLRTQADIHTAHWYQWNNGDGGWGLVFSIGDPKPSYFAFQAQCGQASPPTANFGVFPTSGMVPLTVQFSDSSTGIVDTYAWDFGDLGTSPLENPVHTYTEPGIYDVALTVTGPGGQDSITQTAAVTVNSIGDYDADIDTDMADVHHFQQCFDGGGAIPVICETNGGILPEATMSYQLVANSGSLAESISSSDALQGLSGTVEAGGFHEATPGGSVGGLSDLTDGVEGINVEAVLADHSRPALTVRYDLPVAIDIDHINVFAANNDGRVFQNYYIEYSSTGSSDFSTLIPAVRTGPLGVVNNGIYNHSLTTVSGDAPGPIAVNVDALRFVFYAVSTIDPASTFWDPWDLGEAGDVDNKPRAYVAPVLKEIDVFEYTGVPIVSNEVDLDDDGDADGNDLSILLDNLFGPG